VIKSKLEVWIDADFLDTMTKVGTLSHDRGNVRFNYDKGWLAHPSRFDIDPDLSLDDATFHPNPEVGNFGIFLDSSPDRWGQTLMKRREALEAKDQKRSPRNLYAWDFRIGVQLPFFSRQCQNIDSVISYSNRMFKLRTKRAIFGDSSPTIAEGCCFPSPNIDHRFDGKNHPCFEA
jgi:hypothetical protein